MWIFRNAVIVIFLFVFAVFFSINSQTINIKVLPDSLNFFNFVINVPAFIVMIACIGLGLVLGTFSEYYRASRDRRISRNRLRELKKLTAKVEYLTKEKSSDTDEILTLLK